MTFKYINSIKTREAIREGLNDKAAAVIAEMQDAPDQQVFGLTRDQVAKLHASYEVRQDHDDTYVNDDYNRDVEGAMRASKYPPEVKSDYLPDDPDALDNPNQIQPAGLMAYDFDFEQPVGSDDEDSDENWSGLDNPFHESVSEEEIDSTSPSILKQVLLHAAHIGEDVELVLGDGASIFLDPVSIGHMIHSKSLDKLTTAVHSIDTFGSYLKDIFGGDAGSIIDSDYVDTDSGDMGDAE